MKPYPKYKDSGLPRVGRIPEHWEEKRAKYLFREIDERSEYGTEELLSVSHITGVTPRSEKNVTMFEAESYEGFKTCSAGDLVINIMWAWMGALGVSKHHGIISSSYGVYRLKDFQKYNLPYLDLLLRTKSYIAEYICRSKGVRSSRLRMYTDDFFRIPIVFPPPQEQEVIMNYLDRKLEEIDRFIANKRKMIELLKEQKIAVINRAATRGINPDVKLKPSGIEWLGEIPEHWEVKRLKLAAKIIMGQSPPSEECNVQGIGKPFLQGNAEFGEKFPAPKQFCPTAPKIAPKDALLLSVRAPVGALNVSDQDYTIGRGLCAILPHIDTITLDFAFHSVFVSKQELFLVATGSTYDSVTASEVGDMKIVLPPIHEQKEIVEYLRQKLWEIDMVVGRTNREIELIQEYRTGLISDVVMGKVDVREKA